MSRVIRLVLLVLVAAGLASVASTSATAGPPAGPWPRCAGAGDQYCVVSITKNGGAPTAQDDPYVDSIGAGDVRFGLLKSTDGGATWVGDVDPGDTWTYVVNTGSIVPRELFGHIQDVTFSTSGSPSSGGYEFTLTFRPAPISWVDPTGPLGCTYDGGCGDSTTSADPGWQYDGFVTGYVTDLASSGLSASEITDRTGHIQVTNAEDAYDTYDPSTNSLEVRLANPHFRADGTTLATGSYQSFLPNAMLINQMNVPDPSTLTSGSFVISRVGSSATPVTSFVREAGGVRITITGITFSRPRYRIHPKPTTPGSPRRVKVARPSAHSAKVSFKRPLANGGAAITKYQARCRKGSGAWHLGSAGSSPVVVKSLPRGAVSCQVRAFNRLGGGAWSARRSS